MKTLTVLQPWASLIACGAKKIETRSWSTKYRGKIAIHAGMKRNVEISELAIKEICSRIPYKAQILEYDQLIPNGRGPLPQVDHQLPVGAVIAIADLVDCYYIVNHPGTNIDFAKNIKIGAESMTANKHDPDFGKYIVPSEQEIAFGDWTPGRYAWIFDNVQRIDPVPARGWLRLWEWDEKLIG